MNAAEETANRLSQIAAGPAKRLRSLMQALWRVLTFSPADERISFKRNISVAIEPGAVSVASGTRLFSRIGIQGFKRHTFDGQKFPGPDDMASAVALAINDLGITRSEVTLSIPKAWTIITRAELPAVVRENIAEVVSYELDRFTPLAAEDAYYDHRVLDSRNGKIGLLVAAARIDQVAPYIDALREKGLTVNRLTVNLAGIGTLCRLMEPESDTIFAELRSDGYEGALFSDGIPGTVFSRELSREDPAALVEALLGDIESLRPAAVKPVRIVLQVPEADAAMKESLKLRSHLPVSFLGETDLRISVTGSRKNLPYAAAGAVADSLRPKSSGLNLLSKGRQEQPRTPLALSVLLGLILCGLGAAYLIMPFRIEEQRLAELDGQILQKKDEVRKVEALKKEAEELSRDLETITQFKEGRVLTLSILKELSTALPKSAWITRVKTTDTLAEIEGYASSATEALPRLEASKLFRKAEFASPTFRDARLNADRFIVRMDLEGAKSPEGEGAKDGKK